MARIEPASGARTIAELREFAVLDPRTQRYVRRSLDVGLGRADAVARWSRDPVEATAIKAQGRVYARLADLRRAIPDDSGLDAIDPFLTPLIAISAFDLGQGRLPSFAAYRFLYERLVGVRARPWLPSAFCAAAALPHLHPAHRGALLRSLSEAAATAPGWSVRDCGFVPDWVDKVDFAAPAH